MKICASMGGPTSVKTPLCYKVLSMSFIESLPALEFVERHWPIISYGCRHVVIEKHRYSSTLAHVEIATILMICTHTCL